MLTDLSSVKSCGIHLRAISYEMLNELTQRNRSLWMTERRLTYIVSNMDAGGMATQEARALIQYEYVILPV